MNKERTYHLQVHIIIFIVLLLADKVLEAILILGIDHLIEIKYELKELNKTNHKRSEHVD